MTQTKQTQFIVSLAIIAAWTLLVFITFYHDNSCVGSMFGVSIMYYLTRNFALALGLLLLFLRIIRVMKTNYNLLYIFTGSLNLVVSVSCIVLYFCGEANMAMLHEYLLNLLTGFLIIVDVLFISSATRQTGQDVVDGS